MPIQTGGRDLWAAALGGDLLGETGTATATSATSLTTNSARTAATNDLAGHIVVASGTAAAGTTHVYGVILSNTSGTNTVLTVDRWNTYGSPGGAAGTTPAATTLYSILPGNAPGIFMALTANSTTPTTGGSDTTLAGEITTGGGGLVRTVATYAHTAGTNTYTLTKTFTANGSDSLPVTIAKIGVFNAQNAGRLLFETLLSATATLSASGDNVQITDTVTGT